MFERTQTTPAVPSPDATVVGFVGTDGAGTTTHANNAIEFVESRGLDSQRDWARFDHRLSLPVLAFARMAGLTEVHGDPAAHTVRAHTFEESPLLGRLYAETLLWDQRRLATATVASIRQSTDVLVCDRFVLDGLVDLVVSTKEFDYLVNDVARRFWRLVPGDAVLIGLDCGPGALVDRRPDVAADPHVDIRVRAYRRLFEDERITVIDTSQPPAAARREVRAVLEGTDAFA